MVHFGLDRGPSDCGAQKVPGLCSHAMPLGGRTHHLSVSAAAKWQQLASTCWYLLLARRQLTWTAVHEAHSHRDACAGCGRDQWSGGAQPCLSTSAAAADALETAVCADLVDLVTCLVTLAGW